MVLFGGSKIGGFAKNLGEGLKEFKKATRDEPESTVEVKAPSDSTTKID
jgi:Sec-independent protein translocase protein TatA